MNSVPKIELKYDEDRCSPLNPTGKKEYDREFLLSLQQNMYSLAKPENLPDLPDVILENCRFNEQHARPLPNKSYTISDFLPPGWMKSLVGSSSVGRDLHKAESSWIKSMQVKKMKEDEEDDDDEEKSTEEIQPVTSSSIEQPIRRHKAQFPWFAHMQIMKQKYKDYPHNEELVIEQMLRKMRGILNKLTPQKFAKLIGQIQELEINTETRLTGVTDLIFEKAIDEPKFSVPYALLCKTLSSLAVQPEGNIPGAKPITFRVKLLARCQAELDKDKANEIELGNREAEIHAEDPTHDMQQAYMTSHPFVSNQPQHQTQAPLQGGSPTGANAVQGQAQTFYTSRPTNPQTLQRPVTMNPSQQPQYAAYQSVPYNGRSPMGGTQLFMMPQQFPQMTPQFTGTKQWMPTGYSYQQVHQGQFVIPQQGRPPTGHSQLFTAQQQGPPQMTQAPPPRQRKVIRIQDPNSGQDVTDDIIGAGRITKSATPPQQSSSGNSRGATPNATDEKKKKMLELELEEAQAKSKRRSTGNIRFIGELFKLKMLTEKIMHQCLTKLFQQKDEESLECLCRLFTTIGKGIDQNTREAKTQMDTYFIRMQTIIDEKLTSARIRFMLMDVIDLRQNNWVPRRTTNEPKTVDQLHKEAAAEKKRNQYFGGGSGQRGGPMGGLRVDDGWTAVSTKPVDMSRMKPTKQNVDEHAVQLGPGSRPGQLWGRGSTGGSKQPVADLLLSIMGNSDITTPRESRLTRAEPATTMPKMGKMLTASEMESKAKAILEEYLHIDDKKEALHCISELEGQKMMNVFVEYCYIHVLERSESARKHTALLLHDCVKQGFIRHDDFLTGVKAVIELAVDFEIDVSKIWQYLGELIGPMMEDSTVPLSCLSSICLPIPTHNKQTLLVLAVLKYINHRMGRIRTGSLWRENGLQWSEFVDYEGAELGRFIRFKKLEYTLSKEEAPSNRTLSLTEIQTELKTLLQRDAPDEEIFDWIELNVGEVGCKDPKFIRALMTEVCTCAIEVSGFGTSLKFEKKTSAIERRAHVLQKYIDHEQELELQSLYALQTLVHSLEHPSGLLMWFFEQLYDLDILSGDAFRQWRSSTDPAELQGHAVAKESVRPFLSSLDDDDDDHDDDDDDIKELMEEDCYLEYRGNDIMK